MNFTMGRDIRCGAAGPSSVGAQRAACHISVLCFVPRPGSPLDAQGRRAVYRARPPQRVPWRDLRDIPPYHDIENAPMRTRAAVSTHTCRARYGTNRRRFDQLVARLNSFRGHAAGAARRIRLSTKATWFQRPRFRRKAKSSPPIIL